MYNDGKTAKAISTHTPLARRDFIAKNRKKK